MKFVKLSEDEDMLVLRVDIGDGRSRFVNDIYVGHRQLAGIVQGLQRFKDHIDGGRFDLRLGEFGPAYASGALDVHMQFREHGRLLVRASAQSEFSRFEDRELASEATFHLISEPALLDNFILALSALSDGTGEAAELEARWWD